MEKKTDDHSVFRFDSSGRDALYFYERRACLSSSIPALKKKKPSQKGSPFIVEVSVPPLSWLYPCALLRQDYEEEECFTL